MLNFCISPVPSYPFHPVYNIPIGRFWPPFFPCPTLVSNVDILALWFLPQTLYWPQYHLSYITPVAAAVTDQVQILYLCRSSDGMLPVVSRPQKQNVTVNFNGSPITLPLFLKKGFGTATMKLSASFVTGNEGERGIVIVIPS